MLSHDFKTQTENKVKVDSADMQSVAKTIEEMSIFYMSNSNVHSHTRAIGSHLKSVFTPIDQKYNLSKSQDLKAVYTEILEYAGHDIKVKSALDSILSTAGSIEAETGAHVADLLVRTWDLAKNGHYSNACDVVIDNLSQNILTGGGCLAGIAGRLVQPYSHFIQAKLEELSLGEYAKFAHPRYDDELQTALVLSLSEAQSNLTQNHYTGDDLDADFQIALALSKSLHSYRKEQPSLKHYRQSTNNDDELASILEISKYIK
jgi:hypothetical protein